MKNQLTGMNANPIPASDFVANVKYGFKHFLTFRGRSTRPQFWWYFLALCIIDTALKTIGNLCVGTIDIDVEELNTTTDILQTLWSELPLDCIIIAIAQLVIDIILSISLLAATVRRLHDAGHSASLAYINMILYIIMYAGSFAMLLNMDKFLPVIASCPQQGQESSAIAFFAGCCAVLALVGAAALILSIIVLVFLLKPSEPRDNKYGPCIN